MSVRATPEAQLPPDRYAAERQYGTEDRGAGWVLLAGVLLLMVGTLNFIEGTAAASNSHFFLGHVHFIAGTLGTWGWVMLVVGVVEWCVGIGVFFRSQFSRWAGITVLGLNAIVQLLMLPAYPFWSLSILALDILAMYGLAAYGNRISAAG